MRIFSGKCTSAARLDGKTAVITGSNTGIGKITVKDFFQRGARVIMACRNLNKALAAAEEIQADCKVEQGLGQIIVKELDLGDLSSVRQCASSLLESEKQIDLLINNAGVMCCPLSQTVDGFETQFGTNHVGHFLLTLLLLPKLVSSVPARIVNVSSRAHTRGHMDFNDLNWKNRPYSALQAYQQSKLANVLFTKELSRRIENAGIKGLTVYSLHPGVIHTELGRHLDETYFRGFRMLSKGLFCWFLKTPEQGAQTTIYCAVDETAGKETGLYYADCEVTQPSIKARSDEDAKKLWDASLKMVGFDSGYSSLQQYNLNYDLNKLIL